MYEGGFLECGIETAAFVLQDLFCLPQAAIGLDRIYGKIALAIIGYIGESPFWIDADMGRTSAFAGLLIQLFYEACLLVDGKGQYRSVAVIRGNTFSANGIQILPGRIDGQEIRVPFVRHRLQYRHLFGFPVEAEDIDPLALMTRSRGGIQDIHGLRRKGMASQ